MRGAFFFCLGVVGAGCALAVACGSSDDSASSPEGGIRDGAISDAKSDAAIANDGGLVTIHAQALTGPIAGATVVFYDPSGTPFPPVMTGADGVATGVVPSGSSVTVSIVTNDAPTHYNYDLRTFLDIAPGDNLVAATYVFTDNPIGLATVMPPSGDAGNECNFSVGCGEQGPSCTTAAVFGLEQSCATGNQINGFAWSLNNFDVIAYANKQNVALVDGGATISGWSWNPTTSTPVAVTGSPPPGSMSLLTFAQSLRKGTVFYAQSIARTFPLNMDGGAQPPMALGLPPPGGLIDNIVNAAYVEYPVDSNGAGGTTTVTTIGSPGDSLALDFSDMPPRIHDVTASYDDAANTATLSWSADSTDPGLVGTTAVMSWELGDGSNLDNFDWVIVSPIGTQTTTPPLTPDLVPVFPSTDNLKSFGGPSVAAIGGDLFPSYAVFRSLIPSYALPILYPTTHGHVRATQIGGSPP